MATLKELSDRTGYSPATISRILTGDPALSVTPEARQRVLEEAGRLNYAATKSRRGRASKSLLRLGVAEMLTPAQRLDDPDTLFFNRRLIMEGDTELGLMVKNALDAMELPVFDPRQFRPPHPRAVLERLLQRRGTR